MDYRIEEDSLGYIKIPNNKLWGAQTQRALKFFPIGNNLMPTEMIEAYAIVKKAAAIINFKTSRLKKEKKNLIVHVCDEILANQHLDMFPLKIWMSGSGTQFNMNVNEVIANRICQLLNKPLGSKHIIHPNDDINMSQSTNDTFPTAMHIACIFAVKHKLLTALSALSAGLKEKSKEWMNIVKIGRTHMQDAIPLTLGQEFSGYVAMLDDNYKRINETLQDVYKITMGGTVVGTGMNSPDKFSELIAQEIAYLTKLPFNSAKNKFAVQGAHDSLGQLSATIKTLANSLYKIGNDIRLLACGPRAGFAELCLPENEPGSSIMPGKVNPTQCEVLTMVCAQVIANDFAVTIGTSGGLLEMNVYKPLIIFNILESIKILSDTIWCFLKYTVKGMQPNIKKINYYVKNSLMIAMAFTPTIGYDQAAKLVKYAYDYDLSLKEAALKLNTITEEEFDKTIQLLELGTDLS